MQTKLPKDTWERVMLIRDDIRRIGVAELLKRVRRVWADFEVCRLILIHASPSCQTYSPADRGFSRHRDPCGRPLTTRAREDDDATRHAVRLISNLGDAAPRALITIENPRSKWFKMVPCIARLMRDARWEWITTSYCKMADEVLDPGKWPRKDTNILAKNVLRSVHAETPRCRFDCKHLVYRGEQARHAVVICGTRYYPRCYENCVLETKTTMRRSSEPPADDVSWR